MPKRNFEDYANKAGPLYFDNQVDSDEPAVHYHPERFADVREAINLLNSTALLDEETACIQYPAGDPEQHRRATILLQTKADSAVDHGLRVISFDIDLTLRIEEDQEENAVLIAPSEFSRLQGLGYIVGTCSDRAPTNQRQTMLTLGQEPHFCIPKELLEWTRKLIPAKSHRWIHISSATPDWSRFQLE